MNRKLLEICSRFISADHIVSIALYGEGHIHDTYFVETRNHQPDYILQKINHNIFRDIPGMMGNIEKVTTHIRQKLAGLPGHDPGRESLTLVKTKEGQSFFMDGNGNYWRMFVFIPGTVTFQIMTDPAMGFEAGKTIGNFQALLSDLKDPLIETIPDFHNMDLRISQFQQAKVTNPNGRVALVPHELLFAEQHFDRMQVYFHELNEKAVVRTTHNDTKLNNILFDRQDKALCLIDLDTVMPGFVHFDYGDALRTMANTSLEDEKDLSKVQFNKDIFDSFTRGYLDAAGGFLAPAELDLLPYAPIFMTYIIGLRFLTDYLNGDVYFRVNHPEHNLERARVQFKLVSEMEKFFL